MGAVSLFFMRRGLAVIHYGDCREVMRRLIAEGAKAQTCVTSPPYWGLRDYGHAGQLGLEKTPDEYVANMVEVFRLVRDLLNDDGTLWLNLGDTYAANRGYQVPDSKWVDVGNSVGMKADAIGLKPKDLIGIPWRVAFALQADGWHLRSDIIWAKPNPMPESVKDRPTRSHEYIFLMSKRERYYYDADAIKEPALYHDIAGMDETGYKDAKKFNGKHSDKQRGHGRRHDGFNDRWDAMTKEEQRGGFRNKRDVWTVATKPYSGAHFAVFPPALIEPCILAGSRSGDVVLDPFFGSGTTGEVAERLGRKWIGIELNEKYAPLQRERVAQAGMVL
jgi:DNA modification methylase